MTDEEKYAPNLVWVDRKLTARTIEAWNEEARSRAKDDLYMRMTGRTFLGIEPDPNAAFVVGVMQRHFLTLSREKSVIVRMVPAVRENSPVAVGVISLVESELGAVGKQSLAALRSVCDDISTTRESADAQGVVRERLRFTVHDVWATYERRGNRYAEWLKLTYG